MTMAGNTLDLSAVAAAPGTPNIVATKTVSSWYFVNRHASVTIFVSFDGGTNFLTLPPGNSIGLDSADQSVTAWGSATGTAVLLGWAAL